MKIMDCPRLQLLIVLYCSKLASLSSSGKLPVGLKQLVIKDCLALESICQSLVSLPASGLPAGKLESLCIRDYQSLGDLPNMQNLFALKELSLSYCSHHMPFPKEGLPTTLTSLSITVPKLCHALLQWGLPKLTSLKDLFINGEECPHVVTFPPEGCMLPPTLTTITISGFENLRSLSILDTIHE
ncbi:hypothetical protein Gotur_027863 [Gossypium turneri]